MNELNNQENGDAEFEKYLKGNADKSILTILYALKEKTIYINNFYKTILDAYLRMASDDPLKKDLEKTISKLSRYSMKVISQFDYVLLDDEDEDEGS